MGGLAGGCRGAPSSGVLCRQRSPGCPGGRWAPASCPGGLPWPGGLRGCSVLHRRRGSTARGAIAESAELRSVSPGGRNQPSAPGLHRLCPPGAGVSPGIGTGAGVSPAAGAGSAPPVPRPSPSPFRAAAPPRLRPARPIPVPVPARRAPGAAGQRAAWPLRAAPRPQPQRRPRPAPPRPAAPRPPRAAHKRGPAAACPRPPLRSAPPPAGRPGHG